MIDLLYFSYPAFQGNHQSCHLICTFVVYTHYCSLVNIDSFAMICTVCYDMLRGHSNIQWRGTFQYLYFCHHSNIQQLRESAHRSCSICRILLIELLRIEDKKKKPVPQNMWSEIYIYIRKLSWNAWFGRGQSVSEEQLNLIEAYLSEHYVAGHDGIYRLDFELVDKTKIGTFVLQRLDCISETSERGESSTPQRIEPLTLDSLYTPSTTRTSADSVLTLAREWIEKCSREHDACPLKEDFDSWYPSRLLDLGEATESNSRVDFDHVRLISTEEVLRNGPTKDCYYVTLSHCWGKAHFTTLTVDKLASFHEGIKIEILPRTFQDAIFVARRLSSKIRYIWIDSLCIMQGSIPEAYEDWLRESAQMYQIYRYSYCNLSATAAVDSSVGLFFQREPRDLWETDINLNVEGVIRESLAVSLRTNQALTAQLGATVPESNPEIQRQETPRIERCRILDVSFWTRYVEDAPVNTRGWVFQERLMAPRVLHFCQNQIAFECRHHYAAESCWTGLHNFRMQGGDIVQRDKFKSLIPHRDNGSLGNLESDNPFLDPTSQIDIYRRWKRVVEVYSKMRLTNPKDKLIALAGVAQMTFDENHDFYVAGMWRTYLESQLLWFVDAVYEDGRFYYRSERPKFYRAPTFSWAAVDVPHGINYGEITDHDLLISVVEVDISPDSENFKFGPVKSGYLTVRGVVNKVELAEIPMNGYVRYAWHLVTKTDTRTVMHRNVYLDSPASDINILGRNGRVHCLAARKDTSGYLICLLLQLETEGNMETGSYKRIGLAKIPSYEEGQERMLEFSDEDEPIPYGNWDANCQKHTIRIV
ncbi:HET-domain-containing protein [Mollisia scopiformis]|uniref:HET-domain-containing protein n=1 Tax=Mollisia scopiformis TaxID=149040 RepID=A0A132B3M7_MOLSC|nr:HET-domain-containing protein [Mollisia scopiformis]KUJ07008.1 HET-domain-containing protein [Mollisia scopiformis]